MGDPQRVPQTPPMLDRVAVHQTRLRTPGLGLDAKGVALGAKGLVLLPSADRLVAYLALYTRQGSLEDTLRSLAVEVVRSKLGAREVTLTFAAEGSDRMDRVAEVARLGKLPVVQCVEVRRTGNFFSGIDVQLIALSPPIGNEGICSKRTRIELEEEEDTAVEQGHSPTTRVP